MAFGSFKSLGDVALTYQIALPFTLTHLDELFAALNYLFRQAKQQAFPAAPGESP